MKVTWPAFSSVLCSIPVRLPSTLSKLLRYSYAVDERWVSVRRVYFWTTRPSGKVVGWTSRKLDGVTDLVFKDRLHETQVEQRHQFNPLPRGKSSSLNVELGTLSSKSVRERASSVIPPYCLEWRVCLEVKCFRKLSFQEVETTLAFLTTQGCIFSPLLPFTAILKLLLSHTRVEEVSTLRKSS